MKKNDFILGSLKPFINISRYDFTGYQKQGFGRLGLQHCFRLSHQLGGQGRICLCATNNAGGFYEKCGFYGTQKGKDGYKFFNPLPYNLKLLFSQKDPSKRLKLTQKDKCYITVRQLQKQLSAILSN